MALRFNKRINMAGVDKICGICGEWCDLIPTGKHTCYDVGDNDHSSSEIMKRFEIANVCKKCCEDKVLKGVDDLDFKKCIEESENITKGCTWFVNPKDGKDWRCPNNRLSYDELPNKKLFKMSKAHPWLYEVESEDICVYSRDKRKLRRALRKAGYSGNIRHLIK